MQTHAPSRDTATVPEGKLKRYTWKDMAFPLTLLYVAIALLSPGIFPVEISNLHIQDVLGGLTLLACIFELQGSNLFRRTETYLLAGLMVAAVASIALTGWFGGAYEFLNAFFPNVAPFFFIVLSCRSLQRLKILTVVLVSVALYIILQGTHAQLAGDTMSPYVLCEFCFSGDSVPIMRSRGLGVLNDPNDLGQLLVALLPLLWLRWKKSSTGSNLFLTILPACVLIVGVYFTHSRGGTIALGAVLLFGLKDKLGLVRSLVLSGIGGAAALALGVTGGRGISEDDGGRVSLWYDALQAFKSHPLFGVGARQFADYNHSLTAHNSYLLCLAETGLFGYFFWSGLLVTGWDGLTARINKSAQTQKDTSSAKHPSGAMLQERRPTAPEAPSFVPDAQTFLIAQPQLEPAGAAAFAQKSWLTSRESLPAVPSLYGQNLAKTADDEQDVAYFARIFRVSLVGFLAAAFFLSRTYSMNLYILLGMATCLRGIGPEEPQIPFSRLMKKIWIAMAVSIVILYLAIRIGSHR